MSIAVIGATIISVVSVLVLYACCRISSEISAEEELEEIKKAALNESGEGR